MCIHLQVQVYIGIQISCWTVLGILLYTLFVVGCSLLYVLWLFFWSVSFKVCFVLCFFLTWITRVYVMHIFVSVYLSVWPSIHEKEVAKRSTAATFWSLPKFISTSVWSVALHVTAVFGSTYLFEEAFSQVKILKWRYQSHLTDEHLKYCLHFDWKTWRKETTYTP